MGVLAVNGISLLFYLLDSWRWLRGAQRFGCKKVA